MINVLLVTTWGTACGIAEHSAYLKESVEAADPHIAIVPSVQSLDPGFDNKFAANIVHLNYHAALHSRWTPERIREQQAKGRKVLVTYHDTGVPNSDQCKGVIAAADAAVVHEPFDDLPDDKTYYWRMGVPGPARHGGYRFGARDLPQGAWQPADHSFKAWLGQPVLGTVGFPFPWKNYNELARVTRTCGWALLLIAPQATAAQMVEWHALNPDLYVRTDFVDRDEVRSLLAGCDATAFTYTCANTGQSGAVLQGIAARKPVIALSTCRQFRALYENLAGKRSIRWVDSFDEAQFVLSRCPIQRVDAATVALAEQDSWATLGAKYATLYRELVA